ncbi:bile acid-CoA:amino acid N-acyltransferase-like [Genypterus blacodes]|uniref:bile acid-CoA:amino acid N-acyltransferase-like n=1 Tax=Genypterus blacodes TaxID=154954 RepID=UPI003F776103
MSTMSIRAPPVLSIRPVRGMLDETFSVEVKNLPPGVPVTLHSLHHSEDKDYWEAYGHYVSDHTGKVTVCEDLSFGGTYTGKEAMGLVWSLRPVPGSRSGLRLRKKDVCSPMELLVSLYRGHAVEGFVEQTPLASVLTERWHMAPGVQRIEIREDTLRGTLFIPPGVGPFPGVLDMWGGGGGLTEYRAALLASHGFVTLALDYLGILGTVDGESRYFERAFNILTEHPQVMADRVGVCGLSFGTTVALSLAAYSTAVHPRCCVCISGSHVHSVGESFMVTLLLLLGREDEVPRDEQNRLITKGCILPLTSDLSKKLDVGRINCPVLLINGDDDQNLATVESAEDIAQIMCAAGKEHLLSMLMYPGTGHLIEPPYSPHFRGSNFMRQGKKEVLLWGGETKPHSDAQEDSWRKILAFLRLHLFPMAQAKL